MNVSSRSQSRFVSRRNVTVASAASDYSRRHQADHWILILTTFFLVFGLIVVYSISPGLSASQNISQGYFVAKQLIDVALAAVAFVLAANFPLDKIFKLAKPLVLLSIFGSILVMFTPINAAYPAHRWIRLGTFSFQIVELIKLTLLVGLSAFLARQAGRGLIKDNNTTFKPLLFALFGIGFIVAKLQSDLGSAAVIMAMIGLMSYVAGVPMKRIASILLIVLSLAAIAISTSPYRRERLSTFLHPDSNCQGSSYQSCQALIAVGSGGLFGLGLGYSVQAYGYLPEASNDSIFAIIAEKFGFVGSAIVISLYGLYIARLKSIIQRTQNQAYKLLIVGVLAWMSTQLIINVGAMIGLLPLKGITLPLISQGGTSIVFLTAALGLVYQTSRYTSYNAKETSRS